MLPVSGRDLLQSGRQRVPDLLHVPGRLARHRRVLASEGHGVSPVPARDLLLHRQPAGLRSVHVLPGGDGDEEEVHVQERHVVQEVLARVLLPGTRLLLPHVLALPPGHVRVAEVRSSPRHRLPALPRGGLHVHVVFAPGLLNVQHVHTAPSHPEALHRRRERPVRAL